MEKTKRYCYVDETGQDTQGHLFVVSVVIPENRSEDGHPKFESVNVIMHAMGYRLAPQKLQTS